MKATILTNCFYLDNEPDSSDPLTQINSVKWFYEWEGGSRIIDTDIRIIFPRELELLLKCSGFKIIEMLGDYKGNPINPESPRQIAVCKIVGF